ncbi:MAG: UDPglucose 6-dehydrogenase [Thermosediminibacterales bacterium]|nr:UDPglucose 6-dehydrogenase [Thermosediminibacterales bacterium]MDK2835593.1 UDPglucose 6-dehydrogenase [Thermosediminibacterales bacterium]
MNICVVGTGYVGLVSGICFAHIGHNVICVDKDTEKIKMLNSGRIPIYEKGLEELYLKNVEQGSIRFTNDLKEGVKNSDIIFIAVGTPCLADGNADLTAVESVAKGIARFMNGYKIIVNKSTVPVGTQKWVSKIISENNEGNYNFDVVSNPEFLREGTAVYDTMNPDRIIIGADNTYAAGVIAKLHEPFKAPIIITDPESAEMIKYASNAFLATKISFINEIANICERVGADVQEVARGMGLDKRISDKFLGAGIGFGGACFPKDLKAIIKIGEQVGYEFKIAKDVIEVNNNQKLKPIEKLEKALGFIKGKTIGILGLAFKPNTNDIREAPSLEIINRIQQLGGKVKAYDPKAMESAKMVIKNVEFVNNPYEVVKKADAVILVTEWEEFKSMDLKKVKNLMNTPVFIDGRNVFKPEEMIKMGFEYYCIGKKDYGFNVDFHLRVAVTK